MNYIYHSYSLIQQNEIKSYNYNLFDDEKELDNDIQRSCDPEIWSTMLSYIATTRFELDSLRCGRPKNESGTVDHIIIQKKLDTLNDSKRLRLNVTA